MANWPPPGRRASTPPPLLFPDAPPPDHRFVVEFTSAAPPDTQLDFVQSWIRDDGSGWLTIRTQLDQLAVVPQEARVPISTDGWTTAWDEAFQSPTIPTVTSLKLQDFDRVAFVEVRGWDVPRDEVFEVASTMSLRAGNAPGWEAPLLEQRYLAFGEGGDQLPTRRSIIWSVGDNRARAQLDVATHSPEDFQIVWNHKITSVETIDGHMAIVSHIDDRWFASWMPEPDVSVTLGYVGSESDARRFFESVRPISAAELAAELDPIPTELERGCQSLFC